MAVQRRAAMGPSLRLAALALVVALAASACGGGGGTGGTSDQGGNPVKGGTLRIYNQNDVDFLDTALGYYTVTLALQRAYAPKYKVGPDYGKHIVGSGPYTLKSYTPEKSIELIRNSNWDPATDPLRKAWVDKIEMRIGLEPDAIQQAIERGDADISLD